MIMSRLMNPTCASKNIRPPKKVRQRVNRRDPEAIYGLKFSCMRKRKTASHNAPPTTVKRSTLDVREGCYEYCEARGSSDCKRIKLDADKLTGS